MEMTERRSDDGRDTLSRRPTPGIDRYNVYDGYDDDRPSGRRREQRHVLSRVNGWSLLLAVTSNVLLLLLVMVTGASLIGLVAFGAIGVMSWLLVIAEILSVRRL